MKALLVQPEKRPVEIDIENTLKNLQAIVGGYIEVVYPFEDPVGLVCNEEGKNNHLPPNRALKDNEGNVYDIIAGDFLIVGLGEEDFTDLSPELISKYKEHFKDIPIMTRLFRF